MQLDGAEKGFIYLRTKPTARLNYSFVPPLTKRLKQPLSLLVFLSGVDSKCTAWHYTIVKLREIAKDQNFPLPPMLLYDRYGAGSSDRDPADASRPHNERHDVKEAMFDLQQLIGQIAEQKLDCDEDHPNQLHVIFVGHSMGCCIARLYAAEFPGSVEALLLIDSAISNKAFGDLIPDPDNPTTFSKHTLPADITPEMCRETIRKIRGSPFDFKGGRNSEGIRWDNLPQHLPFSDAPRLRGPMKGLPLVTVICGEPVLLSQVTSKFLRVYEPLMRVTAAQGLLEYSRGLVHIQGEGTGRGPIVAKGCGHDVHVDGPGLVARELLDLLQASARHFQSRM